MTPDCKLNICFLTVSLKSSAESAVAREYEVKFEQHAIRLLEMATEVDEDLTRLLLVRTVGQGGS